MVELQSAGVEYRVNLHPCWWFDFVGILSDLLDDAYWSFILSDKSSISSPQELQLFGLHHHHVADLEFHRSSILSDPPISSCALLRSPTELSLHFLALSVASCFI